MPTVRKVIEWLETAYGNKDEHIAVHIWSEDDVMSRAIGRGIKVTRKQAQDIIDTIDRKKSATLGITWDTIDCHLDDL